MDSPIVLVIVFVISALLGYKVIKNIPSLLHTPLMSGMNALSGITAVGAIMVIIAVFNTHSLEAGSAGYYAAICIGALGLILAMINVVGGFGVTDRMLNMFNKKKKGGKE